MGDVPDPMICGQTYIVYANYWKGYNIICMFSVLLFRCAGVSPACSRRRLILQLNAQIHVSCMHRELNEYFILKRILHRQEINV